MKPRRGNKNNRIVKFWLLKRSKLEEALSFGDSHIDLIGSIVEYGAPRICYYSKFGKRVDPK